ncbi:Hypothetical predicted protein [Mytilus galloprovincialis]|uniref:Uncharacterized protein n=1 Tax=Mytilus galloprovincialis TaxID=29158 RepID=A0A8B6E948_MYTGA|nr:Hypothetical predicted protein [Mytilus galloprovincialis]
MPEGKLSSTTVMKIISSDTSSATVTNRTPLDIRKSSYSTSANTQTSLSTDLTETVTHGSTGLIPSGPAGLLTFKIFN